MNQTAGATNAYRRCSKGGKSCEPSPLLLRGEMMKAGFKDEDERLWEQSWRMWEDRGGERGDSMTAFS
ncbi:hypothetical protein ATANTOWER_006630 [Ataeniobius toweri]|uniref:Uncharacterized protein n=1 Tax=Ataeniobius toweri TaxID=208326 RepID=A0ABU7AN35_9TELE|nr:hypothetical protein [Ataeniobius toweri]